jgi:hypothetical protein
MIYKLNLMYMVMSQMIENRLERQIITIFIDS